MAMSNSERALATLTGEVHALFMFCQRVAALYPNRDVMLAAIDDIHQQGLATIAPTTLPEEAIVGFESAMRALRSNALTPLGGMT